MIEALDQRQQYTLLAVLVLIAAAGFAAGNVFTGNTASSSDMAVAGSSNAVSQDEIRQNVQELMDQRVQRQRQQFAMIANQTENVTEDDLSMQATVSNVEPSEFPSLYEVTVSITGTVPQQFGGGLRDVNQEQVLYLSSDGRYLFQQPTDLEQPRQPAPQQR